MISAMIGSGDGSPVGKAFPWGASLAVGAQAWGRSRAEGHGLDRWFVRSRGGSPR